MACAFLSAGPAATEESFENIQSLWGDFRGGIIGSEVTSSSKSDEEKYRDVFGDVSADDISKLTDFLDNKTIASEQLETSKDTALKMLQQELSSRFTHRIN